ncbi:MAG: hypothetical protein ACK5IB_13415 [Qingshengfaniella sp.]
MRRLICFGLLLVVTGCATAQDRCLRPVTRDIANVQELITETEENIRRGYAYRLEPSPFQWGIGYCTGYSRNLRFCGDSTTDYVRVPEAIDMEAERRKLAELRQREASLQAALPNAQAACAARYP